MNIIYISFKIKLIIIQISILPLIFKDIGQF